MIHRHWSPEVSIIAYALVKSMIETNPPSDGKAEYQADLETEVIPIWEYYTIVSDLGEFLKGKNTRGYAPGPRDKGLVNGALEGELSPGAEEYDQSGNSQNNKNENERQ
jgi:hypothetical protein